MPNYQRRTVTNFIAVHAAATDPDWHGDIGIDDVRKWHTDPKPEGRGWIDVGYHIYIKRDGTIQLGRPLWAVGAHVRGYNQQSIGVCLEGGATMPPDGESVDDLIPTAEHYTEKQFRNLRLVLMFLTQLYPDATVQGHRDFPGVDKACPVFDVKHWWSVHQLDLWYGG